MKKLIYTFLAVSIIFATCKKENNNSSGNSSGIIYGCTDSLALNYNQWATVDDSSCVYDNNTDPILGKWNLIQYDITSSEGYYTNYPNGKVTTWDTTFSITPPDSDFEIESITWEFFSDQTMESVLTEYGYPDSTDTDYYTWIKNGNTLALDTDWVVTINTLTANNLNWTDDSEDTSSYSYYCGGDTVYFNREIGIASWNKISGLSPNTSNARLKQNNRKESPFSSRFINRRKR